MNNKEKFLARRNVNRFLSSVGNKMTAILTYMSSKESWVVDDEDAIKAKCNSLSFDINDIDDEKTMILSCGFSSSRAITLFNEKSASDDDFMDSLERRMLYLGDNDIMLDAVRVARARMIFLGKMNMISKVFDSNRRKSIAEAIERRNSEEED